MSTEALEIKHPTLLSNCKQLHNCDYCIVESPDDAQTRVIRCFLLMEVADRVMHGMSLEEAIANSYDNNYPIPLAACPKDLNPEKPDSFIDIADRNYNSAP